VIIQEETACRVNDLGLMGYDKVYDLQKQYVHKLLNGGTQVLLLCEHPSTLTLGRLADESHILISKEELQRRGVNIYHIDRGGDITLHAPGQLVIYPILDLVNFGKNLRFYLYQLEQVAIDLLWSFDIVANRFPQQTGAWVGTKKIASIGIGVRKWISFHGLAINVNTRLELFSMIKPCGLSVEMTSMAEVKKAVIPMEEVKEKIVECFKKNFQFQYEGN
jgi:lipoate-protein ligase B